MQAGADVMKRIATPMIGGIVTSAILELLIYPVIYVIWRKRELPDQAEEEAPLIPPPLVVSRKNRARVLRWIAVIIVVLAVFYAGNFLWKRLPSRKISGVPFATQTVNDLTVKLTTSKGQLRKGDNNLLIEFYEPSGRPVDVGGVNFTIDMNMPGMVMHGGGPAQRTGAAGQYRTNIKADMAGDWQAKISFDGPHGRGQQSFSVNVK
jgi:hypothetical protein